MAKTRTLPPLVAADISEVNDCNVLRDGGVKLRMAVASGGGDVRECALTEVPATAEEKQGWAAVMEKALIYMQEQQDPKYT
jgi:hypothetical protein